MRADGQSELLNARNGTLKLLDGCPIPLQEAPADHRRRERESGPGNRSSAERSNAFPTAAS